MTDGRFIANARMYAVTPAVEASWRELLDHVFTDADAQRFDYLPYPAPQPLEQLWRRADLGCVFMCGYPIALGLAEVTPIAAPIPSLPWAEGRAVYRSDLIVARESRFGTLEDTFGGTAGWTVKHSHSGFNAFRHHLLQYRRPDRPTLYGRVAGDLVTARAILDKVANREIDVGPLDAYWHALIGREMPELDRLVRTVESTALAPMPAFVAGSSVPASTVDALRDAFSRAASRPWFAGIRETLLLDGFAAVDHATYAATRDVERKALEAGYPLPA